jgi:tetratricopeptide (TPR) repeat protein
LKRPSSLVIPTFLVLLLASTAQGIAQETQAPPTVLDAAGEEYPVVRVSKERISDVGYWQQALAAAPDDVTLQLALGNAYALNRRFKEAIQEYEHLLRTYPESKSAWNNLGSANRALGKMNDALNAYKKALDQDPRYGLAYYNIGAVYDHMGYYDKALKNYSVAIRYDPTLTDSKRNPQVVTNKRLYAVLLQNYVESAGSLALPLEPAYPENPKE